MRSIRYNRHLIAGALLIVALAGTGSYILGVGSRPSDLPTESSAIHSSPEIHLSPIRTQLTQTPRPCLLQPSQTVSLPGWHMYLNHKYCYLLQYPPQLQAVEDEQERSTLFWQSATADSSQLPTFYVSVFHDGFHNHQDGVVYNFLPPTFIESFHSIQIGDEQVYRSGDRDFYDSEFGKRYSKMWQTFRRLSDASIDGAPAIVIENAAVWERAGIVKDRRALIKRDGVYYMIGTYYGTEHQLKNFQQMLTTFVLGTR